MFFDLLLYEKLSVIQFVIIKINVLQYSKKYIKIKMWNESYAPSHM
jgi:hypothetical protein